MIFSCQGSEEKTIVYVLDNGICQTWKHVYTAVTRGQSRVYVIVRKNGLETAIRAHVTNRNTRLGGLVVDTLHDLGIAKKDFLTQPSQAQFSTPKRGSVFTHEPSLSPGPDQPYPGIISLKNPPNPDRGFGGLSSPKSASPSPCKRGRVSDYCTIADKKSKVRIPNILHTHIT